MKLLKKIASFKAVYDVAVKTIKNFSYVHIIYWMNLPGDRWLRCWWWWWRCWFIIPRTHRHRYGGRLTGCIPWTYGAGFHIFGHRFRSFSVGVHNLKSGRNEEIWFWLMDVWGNSIQHPQENTEIDSWLHLKIDQTGFEQSEFRLGFVKQYKKWWHSQHKYRPRKKSSTTYT